MASVGMEYRGKRKSSDLIGERGEINSKHRPLNFRLSIIEWNNQDEGRRLFSEMVNPSADNSIQGTKIVIGTSTIQSGLRLVVLKSSAELVRYGWTVLLLA